MELLPIGSEIELIHNHPPRFKGDINKFSPQSTNFLLNSLQVRAAASDSSSWLAPLAGAPAASQSITQLLASRGVSPGEVEQALLGFTASGYGYPVETPAPYFYRFVQLSIGPLHRLKAGYQDLLERMAARAGAVTCHKGVQEVVRSKGDGVKIVFEGGEERTFDKAIVTGATWMGAAPPQGWCVPSVSK